MLQYGSISESTCKMLSFNVTTISGICRFRMIVVIDEIQFSYSRISGQP